MNIAVKINLLILGAILGTLCIILFSTVSSFSGLKKINQSEINTILQEERKKKLIDLIGNASAVLGQEKSGKDAIAAINAMRFGKEKKNYFFVVDTQGQFIIHPHRPDLLGTNQIELKSLDGQYIIKEMIKQTKVSQKGFLRYKWEKPHDPDVIQEKLTFFQKVPGKDWIIGTGVFNDDIQLIAKEKERLLHQNLKTGMRASILIVIGFAVLFVLASMLVVKKIFKPVRQVAEFADRVGRGDLTAQIDYTSNDEIGVMAASMQKAVKDLASLIQQMVSTSSAVTVSSTRLLEISQDLKNSSNEMENNSNHANQQTITLSSRMEKVLTATDKINEQLDSIAGVTDGVSANTRLVGEKMESVSKETTSAACAVEQMYASFNETAKNSSEGAAVTQKASGMANETNELINRLADAAREIGQIIEMIQTIASQTHLLSMNAAIEAAGAGDAGKGFFVVANEVKELANQTESSAGIISSKIRGMQSITQEAVDVIHSIVQVIDQIDQIMFAIASSVEEQTVVTNDISSSINSTADSAKELHFKAKENMDAIFKVVENIENTATESDWIQDDVKNTSVGIQQVSNHMEKATKAVQTSVDGIEEIQDQARELALMAKQLKRAIEMFKFEK